MLKIGWSEPIDMVGKSSNNRRGWQGVASNYCRTVGGSEPALAA
jgi:hypothetical protein